MSSGRCWLVSIAVACACAACASPASNDTSHAATPAPPLAAAPATPPQTSAPVAQSTPTGQPAGNLIDHPLPLADADIPPLPTVAFVPPRPMEVVRAVFVFAAKHPEVLSHIPCFCGCQQMGHQNNDDCFVKRRDAQERPVAWEVHGMGWGVCLDVARDAMQMYGTGATVPAIRAAIEAKYRPTFNSMTPTPPIKH